MLSSSLLSRAPQKIAVEVRHSKRHSGQDFVEYPLSGNLPTERPRVNPRGFLDSRHSAFRNLSGNGRLSATSMAKRSYQNRLGLHEAPCLSSVPCSSPKVESA